MAGDRVLTQQEIDRVFRSVQKGAAGEPKYKAQPYDFRRPDRIAKDQLRSLHVLHENFARALGSSLSAYLRAYVVTTLVSVEQLAYVEFSRTLPMPTCLLSLSVKGFDNNCILEINPSVVFPLLELLLGGSGSRAAKVSREVTEIERAILDALFRILLKDLRDAWRETATELEFSIEDYETDPQLLQILSPNEPVVAVSLEIRIGEISGMMNLGIPSIIIKMLGRKLEQHPARKNEVTESETARMMRLVRQSQTHVDARLQGPQMTLDQLLKLDVGQVLTFDYPIQKPVTVTINGKRKFLGQMVSTGMKRAVLLEDEIRAGD